MDSIGSMRIAGYIFFMAYVALKESTSVLVDSVNDALLRNKIKRNIEKRFNVRVSNIMIRPLGYSFAVEVSIKLNKNITLGKSTEIVENTKSSVVKTFKTGNTLIVPLLDFV